MKNELIQGLIMILVMIIIGTGIYMVCSKTGTFKSHVCIDPMHKTCDGTCECDGMECPGITYIY